MEDLHPYVSGKIIVHVLVKLILFEYPSSDFIFFHEVCNDLNRVGEIAINLFLSEANVVRIVWISIHVLSVLFLIVLHKLLFVFDGIVPLIVVCPKRL